VGGQERTELFHLPRETKLKQGREDIQETLKDWKE